MGVLRITEPYHLESILGPLTFGNSHVATTPYHPGSNPDPKPRSTISMASIDPKYMVYMQLIIFGYIGGPGIALFKLVHNGQTRKPKELKVLPVGLER